MEKKHNILIYGFIALIFLSVFVMSRFQKAPQTEVQKTSIEEAKQVSTEKVQPEAVAKHELEPVAEVKPEAVVKHETKPAAKIEPEPVAEPVAKVEPTVESEPVPAPTVEVKSADFDIVPLEDQDCTKCHPYAVKDINERGGLHQSIGCSECHLEHPPLGNNPIPTCEMCHDPGEAAHYNIKNCSACHYPHYPTEMKFGEINVAACLSCHSDQGKEMEAEPSEHAALNCTECHMVHREWANCADCHTPHADEMTQADCLACHKPHSPKAVNYADGIPNNYCACCHEDVGNALASSKKAHSEMGCIECHESEHMAVTQCDGCHGADLHGASMHERYPLCLDCHNNPHALAE